MINFMYIQICWAYWRFNAVQEDGKTVRDETGNGFDAISTTTSIQWIDNVKCPF